MTGPSGTGDRLAEIEARAQEVLADGVNEWGFGYEHMGDMWRDLEPLARDVLALVEVAKAARSLQETEWWAFIGWQPPWDRHHDIDSAQEALAAALARLNSGAAE